MVTENSELIEEKGKLIWYKTSPFLEALIGIAIISLASIAILIQTWISFPDSIVSIQDLLRLLIDSFTYVLGFDLKLWWVFFLILYIITKKNNK